MEQCGGTVWNGVVDEWNSVVEQCSIVSETVWWNSGTM